MPPVGCAACVGVLFFGVPGFTGPGCTVRVEAEIGSVTLVMPFGRLRSGRGEATVEN